MDKNEILKMPLLDILSKWEKTEEIIKSYDDEAGTCICCNINPAIKYINYIPA